VRHFGTDPQRLLALPVRIFWSMTVAVERLEAAESLSLFDVMQVAQAGDQAAKREFRDVLRQRLGTVSRTEKPRSSRDEIMAALVEM
jgi:hypothetical protein